MKIGPALTQNALQECFSIRRAVFIDEQGIPEAEEWDNIDDDATHFLAWGDTGPCATARLYRDGKAARIGRVAVIIDHRGTGLGRKIMHFVLRHAKENEFEAAVLDAQTYALPFYEGLGFVADGPEFDDGSGILHRRMTLSFHPTKSPA